MVQVPHRISIAFIAIGKAKKFRWLADSGLLIQIFNDTLCSLDLRKTPLQREIGVVYRFAYNNKQTPRVLKRLVVL